MTFKKKILTSLFALLLTISIPICALKWLKKSPQPHLTIIGSFTSGDGSGRYSAEIIHVLKNALPLGFKANGPVQPEDATKGINSIFKNKKSPLGKVILYQDSLGQGGMSFKKHIKGLKNLSQIRIAYSVFESSRIPPEWALVLNYYFDAVAVPDPFLVDVYKNSGVIIPIFVLPYPVNLDKFYRVPLRNKKHSPFTFANFSNATAEKNHITLVRAFHDAFDNSQEVKLRLNSCYSDPKISEAIKKEIRLLKASNVEFTEMILSEELYLKTFENIDCYVSLSQGEGCPIQPKEAMALGIPVILSDNTAQSTLCASHLTKGISSLTQVPGFYSKYQNTYGVFYDCSVKETSQALQDVYGHYGNYLQITLTARDWVKQYSYDRLKPLYLGLVSPKKIVLGNINQVTANYLITDSKELCEKFAHLLGTPFEDQTAGLHE